MSTMDFKEEDWELEGVLCYYEDWALRCNHQGCKQQHDTNVTLEEFGGKNATLYIDDDGEFYYK